MLVLILGHALVRFAFRKEACTMNLQNMDFSKHIQKSFKGKQPPLDTWCSKPIYQNYYLPNCMYIIITEHQAKGQ